MRNQTLAGWLAAILSVGVAPVAFGVDADGDGMSDVWQRRYGITSAQANQDFNGTGLTNIQKSIAGLHPYKYDPFQASVQALGSNTYRIQWNGVTGKRYQVQSNINYQGWTTASIQEAAGFADNSLVGRGALLTATTTVPAGSSSAFFRVVLVPSYDSDGDGLDDWEEFLLGTRPNFADTDRDGLTDLQEFQGVLLPNGQRVFTDALNPDSDGDGLLDGAEFAGGKNPTDASDGFPLNPQQRPMNIRLQFRGTWPDYSGNTPTIPNLVLSIGSVASINQSVVNLNQAVANGPLNGFSGTASVPDRTITRGVEYPFTLTFDGVSPYWPTVVGRVLGSLNNPNNDRGNLIIYQADKGYYFTNPEGFVWAESTWVATGGSNILNNSEQQLEARNRGTGRLWAVTFDLDIDSLNQRGNGLPARSLAEEDAEETQAKLIPVNTNDDNGNGVPDYLDTQVSGEQDLIPLILEVAPQSLEWEKVQVKFNSTATSTELRLWRMNTPGGTKDASSAITPGTIYTAAQLGLGQPLPNGDKQTQLKIYAEGLVPTNGTREIEAVFIFTNGAVTREYFKDKVLVSVVPKVSLSVEGVAETEKIAVGGLAVRNADGNNAPRRRVRVQMVGGGDSSSAVILTKNSANISLYTSSTGGSPLSFNGSDNRFTQSQLPIDLYVEGVTASTTMRDIELMLTLDGTPTLNDRAKFTVLWVTMSSRSASSEMVSSDNAGRNAYVTVTGTSSLGAYTFETALRFGSGIELIGTCQPSNFDPSQFGVRVFLLARTIRGSSGYINNTAVSSPFNPAPGGDTTSDPKLRDDDPQSGGSLGKFYDLDAPGAEAGMTNIRFSRRSNYTQYAVIDFGSGWVTCSAPYLWFARTSVQITSFGTMQLTNDYPGDNTSGPGTTPLSLNLQ